MTTTGMPARRGSRFWRSRNCQPLMFGMPRSSTIASGGATFGEGVPSPLRRPGRGPRGTPRARSWCASVSRMSGCRSSTRARVAWRSCRSAAPVAQLTVRRAVARFGIEDRDRLARRSGRARALRGRASCIRCRASYIVARSTSSIPQSVRRCRMIPHALQMRVGEMSHHAGSSPTPRPDRIDERQRDRAACHRGTPHTTTSRPPGA